MQCFEPRKLQLGSGSWIQLTKMILGREIFYLTGHAQSKLRFERFGTSEVNVTFHVHRGITNHEMLVKLDMEWGLSYRKKCLFW